MPHSNPGPQLFTRLGVRFNIQQPHSSNHSCSRQWLSFSRISDGGGQDQGRPQVTTSTQAGVVWVFSGKPSVALHNQFRYFNLPNRLLTITASGRYRLTYQVQPSGKLKAGSPQVHCLLLRYHPNSDLAHVLQFRNQSSVQRYLSHGYLTTSHASQALKFYIAQTRDRRRVHRLPDSQASVSAQV